MDDDNLDDEVSKFLLGFKLMYKQIKDLLAKFEVKEMDPLNKPFDPAYHQAIAVDNKEGILPGTVTEVLQKGYMYKDKVLRTAMVKVSDNMNKEKIKELFILLLLLYYRYLQLSL